MTPPKKMFLAITFLFILTSFPFVNAVGASSELWSQTYGTAEGDYVHSMIQTSDGGYALAGHLGSLDVAGKTDFWLVKTDAQGIPEFPSWAILPLLLVATLTAISYRKKLSKTPNQ